MKPLVWDDSLNTNIDLIDQQHQRIMYYINELGENRIQHPFRPDVQTGRVITDLIEYTISHLGFEESLMEEARYEFHAAHKRGHELFTQKVLDFQTRFQKGEKISDELHGLLYSWLFNHIKNDDANYVRAVQAMLAKREKEKRTGFIGRSLRKFFGA